MSILFNTERVLVNSNQLAKIVDKAVFKAENSHFSSTLVETLEKDLVVISKNISNTNSDPSIVAKVKYLIDTVASKNKYTCRPSEPIIPKFNIEALDSYQPQLSPAIRKP